MTDQEYEILDELYFVITFSDLRKRLQADEDLLKLELLALIRKGWVKVFDDDAETLIEDFSTIETHFKNYRYLATKEGLLAHTGRES